MGNIIFVIVIDVLDECIEYGNRNIFYLFWICLYNFFVNIKFFIMFRIIFDINVVWIEFLVIEKSFLDFNNIKDVNRLINILFLVD